MKIVVVDDEHDVQALFEQRFRREVRSGMLELNFAFSGEDALTLLENRGTADIILILLGHQHARHERPRAVEGYQGPIPGAQG